MISRTKQAPSQKERPGTPLEEWRSGTGRVIRTGDHVYRGSSDSTLYLVKEIREFGDGRVEVSCFGGKPNHEAWRTFLVDDLHQVRREVEVR